jgi:RNA recognition motif-containing protein
MALLQRRNQMNTTVYISNLSYNRDRSGLKVLFSKFGTIKNIKIVVEPRTNQSRGMAFVEMSTVAEAKKAIDNLNEQMIDGRTVKANWATPMKKTSMPAKKAEEDNRDLEYKTKMLAKKARNEAKRKANPFVFKSSSARGTAPKAIRP